MIFRKNERRDLEAAYKFYCGKDLKGAHDAAVDTDATEEVLMAQLEKHPELKDLEVCHEFCEWGNRADMTGHLIWVDGVLTYNFGKNEGKPVSSDIGYAKWMLGNDFSLTTKALLRQVVGGR